MMPPTGLLELIGLLRGRIETHRERLPYSESLTRYVLIDPLLRELGWDTGDPDVVYPEYNPGDGTRADYALLVDGKPFLMLEAKSLHNSLDGAARQGVNYCQTQGTPYFAVTDGDRWEVYETHRPVPLAEKLVVKFDMAEMPPARACLRALTLWRPAAETGTLDTAGASLFSTSEGVDTESSPQDMPKPEVNISKDGWLALHDWANRHQTGVRPKLSEMRFPDGQVAEIRRWRDLVTTTVEWLAESNRLLDKHLPIPAGTSGVGGTYLVADKPFHGTGRPMQKPHPAGKYYVERFRCTPNATAKFTRIVQHVGLDPARFALRFK